MVECHIEPIVAKTRVVRPQGAILLAVHIPIAKRVLNIFLNNFRKAMSKLLV